ncbi:MAG: HAMP domain-containing histidine kinase [Marinifilaceae bacterium]|jgi:two-component system phosphate regulon sensor histidine kinase PhoR|nr:HAMP domain-containing histidine kinase [Marinifilaceae bacterium]
MSRKNIIILAIVMGVALISLITIQTQYFISAGKIRNEQFTHSVNVSLDEIVNKINYLISLNKIQESLYRNTGNPENIKEDNNEDKFALYRSLYDSSRNSNQSYYNIFEKDSPFDYINKPIGNSRNQENINLTTKLISKHQDADLFNKILKDVNNSKISLKKIIKNIDTKSLISNVLEENGIDIVFEFAIKKGRNYIDISDGYINQNTKYRYKRRLNPSNIIKNSSTLHLIFPTRSQILATSFFMLLPSLITCIVLLMSCTITIYVIFKQKRLSTIKNDFINNMTHELKTPISTISLASQMLKDSSVNNSQAGIESISNIIREESNRLTNQIEKVLQMAVFTESRLKLKKKDVNVNTVVNELSSRFSLKVRDKGGDLDIAIHARKDLVYCDIVHLSNIITNLLDNALKYCEGEPKIKIFTQNIQDKIQISVQDNGIGINKKDQKMIFERFFRVSTGNVHNVKGFGLGLSYVKKITEIHGGEVKVDSSYGKGSIFKIILPLSKNCN